MPGFPKKLAAKLQERTTNNALRELKERASLVDFSSNDYLGFSREPKLKETTEEILSKTEIQHGATGSRLLTGQHALHRSLEKYLSGYFGLESALLFNSGYDANLGFFSSVPQRGDVVLYDELVHASIRDGVKLGNATSYKFKHNDIQDLNEAVARCRKNDFNGEVYVVTESVFSMDGDSPNLQQLTSYCDAQKIHLVVDEAHALGVFGKGLLVTLGLERQVFALIITFGKAMGCHGAAILGSALLKTYLVNFARSLIYTTAMPPYNLALLQAAFIHLDSEQGKQAVKTLSKRISYFKDRMANLQLEKLFLTGNAAIQIAMANSNRKAKQMAQQLYTLGLDVRPILSPTVPLGNERLRICLHAYNTEEEMETLLRSIKEIYE